MDTNKEVKPEADEDIYLSTESDNRSKERLDKIGSTILEHHDKFSISDAKLEHLKTVVDTIKKRRADGKAGPILNLVDDKSLVIVGVVVIALVGMWKLTDPTILLTSVVSGLFGVATGRSMSGKDKNE